jgi:cell division protein ZapA
MSQDKHTVRVHIFGTEYPIQAEADPAYIQKIAEYVDSRMREITGGAHSTAGVAILTALNIADELYREREEKEKALSQLNDQIDALVRRLDQALEQNSRPAAG